MLEFGLVAVLLAEAGGLCSRDLHCDIVCNSGELIVADLKKYADFAAEVDIGINDAFNAIEAADGDLFADLCNCAVDNVADGLALVFGEGLSHHIFNGSGILLCNMFCKGSNKVFEIVGLCNKVGFAVDFDDDADAAFFTNEAVNNTFCRNAGSLLCGCSKALLAQIVESLFNIAVTLFECLLQSIMPAPERSRRAITSLAVNSIKISSCSYNANVDQHGNRARNALIFARI